MAVHYCLSCDEYTDLDHNVEHPEICSLESGTCSWCGDKIILKYDEHGEKENRLTELVSGKCKACKYEIEI